MIKEFKPTWISGKLKVYLKCVYEYGMEKSVWFCKLWQLCTMWLNTVNAYNVEWALICWFINCISICQIKASPKLNIQQKAMVKVQKTLNLNSPNVYIAIISQNIIVRLQYTFIFYDACVWRPNLTSSNILWIS